MGGVKGGDGEGVKMSSVQKKITSIEKCTEKERESGNKGSKVCRVSVHSHDSLTTTYISVTLEDF